VWNPTRAAKCPYTGEINTTANTMHCNSLLNYDFATKNAITFQPLNSRTTIQNLFERGSSVLLSV